MLLSIKLNKKISLKRNTSVLSKCSKKKYSVKNYDYDLIVIGGGSGGLAAAKDAADLGKKVALFDYVSPSTQGTKWGIGGTCVNVGCIPKKLMHRAAIVGEDIHEANSYGWSLSNVQHDWGTLVENVQMHIKSLNFGYRVKLNEKKVKVFNSLAQLEDKNTVKYVNSFKKTNESVTAENILISVGGRPVLPQIPGALENCITSDDLFSLSKSPGKTLVIGASYVSLECAGFLTGLGYDTTVMVRSVVLRGFDQQMAELIHEHMVDKGTKFLRKTVPVKIDKLDNGQLRVFYQTNGEETKSEIYDTVLAATGRYPLTKELNCHGVGLEMDKSGKLIVNQYDQTNVDNIYAIGDVVSGRPELTPVAIQSGKLLVERLYNNSQVVFSKLMVPTTVFTPIEYGTVGLTEEEARECYGDLDLEVYHAFYTPLEYYLPHRTENQCYIKLICVISQNERVVGLHILGPNAGEVTQGFATAIRMGATKKDFDSTVGIHPTVAEEFTGLNITKRSGEDPKKTGC